MRDRFTGTVPLAICILVVASLRASGQEVPEVQPRAPERVGSPVETLESLTRERPERIEEIETDRDSFTPATTIVGRRRLIVESAYSFLDNRGVKETHSFPELLLRYGLTERVELRLGWNAEIGGSGNDITGSGGEGDPFASEGHVEREYTVGYGVKLRVSDQNSWIPRSVIILQGSTPTGGSPGSSNASRLVGTYAAGWLLPSRLQFDTAMRYGFGSESGDHFNQWAPSTVLRIPLGEKLATHIEYFALFTSGLERNRTKHFISPGLRYLITPDLEVGVRFGWGLNDQSTRFFATAGFGWQF